MEIEAGDTNKLLDVHQEAVPDPQQPVFRLRPGTLMTITVAIHIGTDASRTFGTVDTAHDERNFTLRFSWGFGQHATRQFLSPFHGRDH